MALFPDFSALADTGETLTKQFASIVSLLQKLSDDVAAVRSQLEGAKNDNDNDNH
jgi:hypothetical protein